MEWDDRFKKMMGAIIADTKKCHCIKCGKEASAHEAHSVSNWKGSAYVCAECWESVSVGKSLEEFCGELDSGKMFELIVGEENNEGRHRRQDTYTGSKKTV